MAQAFGKKLGRGAHVSVFKNFGTAQVKFKDTEVPEALSDAELVYRSAIPM